MNPDPDQLSPPPTIIIPSDLKRDTVSDLKRSVRNTWTEYSDAARQMHLPVPVFRVKSPQSATPPAQIPPRPEINIAAAEFIRKNDPQYYQTENSDGRIIAEIIETENAPLPDARILSQITVEPVKGIVKLISSMFFGISFIYMTLTLLLFGVSTALYITMTNAGSPGFIYLKYYPGVGLLPVVTCLIALISMYVAHQVQDSSRLSWILAVLCLAIFPIYSSLAMPVMAYPLVKMASVFAGTGVKPIISPSLSVATLAQYFSVLLIFEAGLLILLFSLKTFIKKPHMIDDNARTALLVIFLFIFLPVGGVSAYGYWNSQNTDFDLGLAESRVPYHIYMPAAAPAGRTPATNFTTDEELAGSYNAVKVIYDAPLPTLIQTGIRSPIIIKQVNVLPGFTLEKFATKQDRDSGTNAEPVSVLNTQGYVTLYKGYTTLWVLLPDNVLLSLSSATADIHELISLAETMK